MRAIKIASISVLIFLLISTGIYCYLIYKNNIDIPAPPKQTRQQALNKSINWVLKNQNELVNINNPVLWWFLDESASLTNNTELAALVRKYRRTVLDKKSIWTGYFVIKPPFTYEPGILDRLEKYQKFFAYGLTCNQYLGEEKTIHQQLDLSFCDWRPYYSSCITHQMMGIRLLQIKQCGDQNINQQLSIQLASKIESQLIWDPRVGDVYIQRALMLAESGNRKKIKPIWIQKILNEQLEDGSWASFDKLLHLYNDSYLGFGYKFPAINIPKGNFHSTAQAIYLLSLLNVGNEQI